MRKNRRLLLTAAAGAAVAALVGASAVPTAAPAGATAGADDATLHEQLWSAPGIQALRDAQPGTADADSGGERRIQAALDALIDQGATGATARVEAGEHEWQGASGTRAQDTHAPALPHSPFRAASNTKMMISALVLQEVEAGTWSLDTPIDEVVRGIFPAHADVTLRQLLSHTGGVPNGTLELLQNRIDDLEDTEAFIAALDERYPDAEHIAVANGGEWTAAGEYAYSNLAFTALGLALEVATGQSVGDLLQERIFDPVGMHSTSYPDAPGLGEQALQEAVWDGTDWYDLQGFDPTFFSHAGAVVSTTEDLSAFTEAIVSGELISPELVEVMVQPVAQGGAEYGLGIYRVPDPCVPGEWLYGHDGGAFGTTSVVYSSADGERQISFGVTGRDMSGGAPQLYDLSKLLQPMLVASCR